MFPNIDAERARLGWSRVKLAQELNVSYSTMKNWMKGKTEIPASKVIRMAELFSCSTDYLLASALERKSLLMENKNHMSKEEGGHEE